MRKRWFIPLGAAFMAALFMVFPGLLLVPEGETHDHEHPQGAERWACPMLCVVLEHPGLCPVCGMELEEIEASDGAVTVSASERELTGLTLVLVEELPLRREISVPGTVTGAETATAVVTAWTSGRIESFQAPATGENISSGAVVARIYSPELIEAQHDLLYALRSGFQDSTAVEGAEHRLERLGVSRWMIEYVRENGTVLETLPVVSSYSGTVTARHVESGDWVHAGQVLLETANLSEIWIEAQLLEGQEGLLSTGDSVLVETRSGGFMTGIVMHMDPYFDPVSRSLTARITADSPEGELLSGQLVSVMVSHQVGGSAEPDLAVPASAVLSLGSSHLVYVLADDGSGIDTSSTVPHSSLGVRLVPVQVELGPLSVDDNGHRFHPVISGLETGMMVVDNGAFLVDSQAELTGLVSLMRGSSSE